MRHTRRKERDGLTLRAPLEDTADETDCLYFIGG